MPNGRALPARRLDRRLPWAAHIWIAARAAAPHLREMAQCRFSPAAGAAHVAGGARPSVAAAAGSQVVKWALMLCVLAVPASAQPQTVELVSSSAQLFDAEQARELGKTLPADLPVRFWLRL